MYFRAALIILLVYILSQDHMAFDAFDIITLSEPILVKRSPVIGLLCPSLSTTVRAMAAAQGQTHSPPPQHSRTGCSALDARGASPLVHCAVPSVSLSFMHLTLLLASPSCAIQAPALTIRLQRISNCALVTLCMYRRLFPSASQTLEKA
jgi:hypothetical protein